MLLGLMGIAVMQRQKIADMLIDELSEQVSIPLRHSSFDFSLAKSFPLASMVLHDITVMYPQTPTDTLLHINELVVSFDLIDVINRNYQIRGIKINGAIANLKADQLKQLGKQFEPDKDTDNQPTNIQFDHIAINNLSLRHYDGSNILCNEIFVDKTKIFIKLNTNSLSIQLNGIAQSIEPKSAIQNMPFDIEAAVNKKNDVWHIDALNVKHKHLNIYSKGDYAKQQLTMRFSTNSFKAQRVANMLGLKFIQSGTCRASGILQFADGQFGPVAIQHNSSDLRIGLGREVLHIGHLNGESRFSHNFKRHRTEIAQVDMRLGEATASGAVVAKGLQQMAVLADMDLSTNGLPVVKLPKGWDIAAQGHAKLLGVLNLTNLDSVRFNLIDTRSTLQLQAETNPLLPSLTNLHGTAHIGKHIELRAQAMLQGKPITTSAIAHNTLNIINKGELTSLNTSIKAQQLDLGKLIDEITQPKTDSTSNFKLKYIIDYNVDTLYYLNKNFYTVSGRFYEYNDTLYADNLQARLYSGSIADGIVAVAPNGVLGIEGKLRQMDVSSLFADFNNFKQQIVTAENISGTLNAQVKMRFATTPKDIDMQSLRLASNVELHNGKLRGMDKIKQLNKWLNLSEVKSIDFNTLTNTIAIDSGWVHIPSMDIRSNVLGIKLDGRHSFSGPFDYHVRLNVAQLLANRFLNKSGSSDFERQKEGGLHLNLLISGDSTGYQVRRDKERNKQQIRNEVDKERTLLQNIMREEFGRKRDTIDVATDSVPAKPKSTTGYRLIWDDDDE